jgi:hypothetical protein
MMTCNRRPAGRSRFVFGVLLFVLPGLAAAADSFPFDRYLLLDAAPMRPGKRIPMITIAANGDATLGLWCKTVAAHVEVSDDGIKIEPGPLPDALPEMMARDQCTPARMQADQNLLDAFAQVTGWHSKGDALVLDGPTPLKFSPATN